MSRNAPIPTTLVSVAALALLAALAWARPATAAIDGIMYNGAPLTLHAKADHISTPDGGSYLMWGYSAGANARAQYPGPTLIVDEGQVVTINLVNDLPGVAASLVFPGQGDVLATGGAAGLLTQEAPPDGATTVTYTFTADNPGTYLYHSGTSPELQIEMGMLGAIIVRPSIGNDHAYNHADTQFDREYLFLLSEMDPRIHETVAFEGVAALEGTSYLSSYVANYWFINGRTAPDTLAAPGVPWLPTQPYNIVPQMHPGDRVLMRIISAGRQEHPFHHHGNHARVIAQDGRMLSSSAATGADLSYEVFTVRAVPGETTDAIFTWTGAGLGWDIYGTAADGAAFVHDCIDTDGDDFDDVTVEYCPDHDKPMPVVLPEALDLAFGGFYGGSPFLGSLDALPPGEGGLNPNGGFAYMWHSHTERELTNYDIFPGGMMTMLIVEAPYVPLP